MNTTRNNYWLCLCLCLCCHTMAMAQTNPNDLSPEELQKFKELCQRKINDFEVLVSQIATKDAHATASQQGDRRTLNIANKRQVLRLFINKGTNCDGNGSPCTIEVSSLRNPTQTHTIANYLNHLEGLNYASVTMERSEVSYVSNFFPKDRDDEGYPIYSATASVCMKFTGKDSEGNVTYTDITCKQIEVELKRARVWGEQEEKDWSVLLGDITVSTTEVK